MKVVICISSDNERSGGSFRVAEVAIRSLLRLGIEVNAIIGYGQGGRIKRLLGKNCHLVNAKSWKDLQGWIRMRRLVKQLAPDVIHFASSSNWMAACTFGLPPLRIMHQHFRPNIGPNAIKHIRYARLTMVGSNRVIAISYEAARQLINLCGIPEARVAVVHNAIDDEYLTASRRRPTDKKRLGMAIRVVEDKGAEDAIELLSLMPENFVLTIAGDGPALPRLKALSEEKGLACRVEWLGSIQDIDEFYSAIDYYLYMSWYEGFGLSVAEAMTCGIPVVGLLGDGEIAEPEYPLVTQENSLLLPRSSRRFCRETDMATLEKLRDAIIELDKTGDAQVMQIEAARLWITDRFSSDHYGRQLLQVYRDTLRLPRGYS
ncbi:glycosyltransferase family 4 protein [Aquamicrobium soli]|uniref:Glycosyltransferase family 4 protein n=1 Tax=Aquamicrobium soli TaxID=1811518 RepID=A0ABV7K4U1_9HYPH